MNTLGHHYIADQVTAFRSDASTPEFALGTMLPHLAQAADTELDYAALEGELQEGVQLHHISHVAFYDTHEYKYLWDVVGHGFARFGRLDLVQTGIEALLDGAIIQDVSSTVESFRKTLSWLQDNYQRVGCVGQNVVKLTDCLEDFSYKGIPAYLQSPRGVAHLLVNQFGMRPSENLPTMVADVQTEVRSAAATLLGSVVSRLPL